MIKEKDIKNAQNKWADAIVQIGSLKYSKSDCKLVASQLLDELYAFEDGDILFKPTKAADKQFRPNKEAALSYFIAGNDNFPEDNGFALQPWTKVRLENTGVKIDGDRALAMGNYFFTDEDGEETKVEYTFGYVNKGDGELKIDLHHSSLPYNPK